VHQVPPKTDARRPGRAPGAPTRAGRRGTFRFARPVKAALRPSKWAPRFSARAPHPAAGRGAFTGLANGKFLADLPALAHQALAQVDVRSVFGGTWCTVSDPARVLQLPARTE